MEEKAEYKTKLRRKTWIKVKRGLVTSPKHREKMGMAVWLFLHIVDGVDWETGKFYEWRDADEAEEMNVKVRTLRSWRRKLEDEGYITTAQKYQKLEITVHNWSNPRSYGGEVLNEVDEKKPEKTEDDKHGDNEMEPSNKYGDIHGDIHGITNNVTPTSTSQNTGHTTDLIDLLYGDEELNVRVKAEIDMQDRVCAAMKRNINFENKQWRDYHKKLMKREKKNGQTIEGFMSWYRSDDFRAKNDIYLTPTKIEDWWQRAYPISGKKEKVKQDNDGGFR